MRKGFLFLVMLMAAVMVFADTAPEPLEVNGDTKNSSADVIAFINLKNESSHFVQVGFTSKEVTESNGTLTGADSPAENIELIVDPKTGFASNSSATPNLYLYGFFYIDDACGVKLSAPALQGYTDSTKATPVDGDVIGFTIKDNSKHTLTVADTYSGTNVAVSEFFYEKKAGTDGVPTKSFFCVPLTIATTESVSNSVSNPEGNTTTYYATTITATITAKS